MMDAIARMISNEVRPLIDEILDLRTELEDLRRRAENTIRIGIVESVDAGTGRAVVGHGDLKTPSVRYFMPSAGEQSETRHPSAGEQCLLLNFGGGDSGAQTVAMCGIPCDAFPLPSTSANVTRRTYKDGAASSYDHDLHEFTWVSGPLSVKATRESVEVLLGAVGFVLNAAGVHFLGPLVDHAGKIISKA